MLPKLRASGAKDHSLGMVRRLAELARAPELSTGSAKAAPLCSPRPNVLAIQITKSSVVSKKQAA